MILRNAYQYGRRELAFVACFFSAAIDLGTTTAAEG